MTAGAWNGCSRAAAGWNWWGTVRLAVFAHGIGTNKSVWRDVVRGCAT
ncbi:hypothetical protein AB5I41_25895 [Sphingomonas sp. MMS24-JH45]